MPIACRGKTPAYIGKQQRRQHEKALLHKQTKTVAESPGCRPRRIQALMPIHKANIWPRPRRPKTPPGLGMRVEKPSSLSFVFSVFSRIQEKTKAKPFGSVSSPVPSLTAPNLRRISVLTGSQRPSFVDSLCSDNIIKIPSYWQQNPRWWSWTASFWCLENPWCCWIQTSSSGP